MSLGGGLAIGESDVIEITPPGQTDVTKSSNDKFIIPSVREKSFLPDIQ
jgi:hypothetical protein